MACCWPTFCPIGFFVFYIIRSNFVLPLWILLDIGWLSCSPYTLCPKSPSVRGLVACLPVRVLFKSTKHNAFYPVYSIQIICRIAVMTKPGKLHCFIWIETIGRQVNTRLNLAQWGSWDTVVQAQTSINIVQQKLKSSQVIMSNFLASLVYKKSIKHTFITCWWVPIPDWQFFKWPTTIVYLHTILTVRTFSREEDFVNIGHSNILIKS